MVCADAGYTGIEKRKEHAGRQVIWQVAARRSTYKKHGKRSVLYKVIRKVEKAKAQVRAKVEHPFRVIKRQSGYTKVRFRGLVKNTAQMVTLFALSNLWMARRHLLASMREVCPQWANGCYEALAAAKNMKWSPDLTDFERLPFFENADDSVAET